MKKPLRILLWCLGIGLLHAQNDPLGSEAQREAGKKIYDQKCAQCHGYNGDGNGVAKEFFQPQPRDFTAAIFKFRTTPSGELPTHDDMKRSIRQGMPYTGMPAWPEFSDRELSNLAYYVKSFAAEDFREFGNVQPVEIPSAPSYSEESAQRGRVVYEENQCIDCHGNYGRGDGRSAPTLKDQWDQPIRPADLTKRWTFRGGSSREDIYRTFTTGLDGSPMPSYNVQPPEDQWALVDYVYSLGKGDKPNYATLVVAKGYQGTIDIGMGKDLFAEAESAYFPVVGQVIEPGRAFFPGVNGIEVKAVYNEDDIAFLLVWHDMSAQRHGKNGLLMEAPRFTSHADTTGETFSDALAIQFPSRMPDGNVKPYFLFGDTKNSVDLWFVDLAKTEAQFFVGRGGQDIEAGDSDIEMTADYQDGEWNVILKRSRASETALTFEEGVFVPVAFSVWDGFNKERGNKRGLTSWYYLYLEPLQSESPLGNMVKYALLTLVLQIAVIGFVRLKYKNRG